MDDLLSVTFTENKIKRSVTKNTTGSELSKIFNYYYGTDKSKMITSKFHAHIIATYPELGFKNSGDLYNYLFKHYFSGMSNCGPYPKMEETETVEKFIPKIVDHIKSLKSEEKRVQGIYKRMSLYQYKLSINLPKFLSCDKVIPQNDSSKIFVSVYNRSSLQGVIKYYPSNAEIKWDPYTEGKISDFICSNLSALKSHFKMFVILKDDLKYQVRLNGKNYYTPNEKQLFLDKLDRCMKL